MKKVFAVLVALALVLSCAVMAFAAGDGKITINNAVDGADYEIYKMLDFAPSNDAGDKGIYTIVDGWEDFFAAAPATNYFIVTDNAGQKTVSAKEGVTEVDQTLAKAAIAYAEENSIDATATKEAAGETVEFTGLDLGYYAIDTSLGTLCALTNTNSTFTATEKNEKPDIDKEVKEDSTGEWGKVNDADIDQVVEYRSTITVGVGATNYVMHDTMTEGLTFNNDVVVKLADGTVVNTTNYTVVYPATDTTNGVVHTFDVDFEDDYILSLEQGTEIVVYYTATLNDKAKIVESGNDNTVYLSYGEDTTWNTIEHKTTTYTWKIDVEKIDAASKAKLEGATFELLDANKNVITFTAVDGAEVPTYKVDKDGAVTAITTTTKGEFAIEGLDEGVYYLHETAAPAGYNKLAEDIKVEITSTLNNDDRTATYQINGNDPAVISVENNTGSLLPETGGIGTTIFYVVGGLLMVCALVVLVSKKRMASFA